MVEASSIIFISVNWVLTVNSDLNRLFAISLAVNP